MAVVQEQGPALVADCVSQSWRGEFNATVELYIEACPSGHYQESDNECRLLRLGQ